MSSTHTIRSTHIHRRLARQISLALGAGMLFIVTGCGAEKQTASSSDVYDDPIVAEAPAPKAFTQAPKVVKWTGAEFHEQAQAALVTHDLLAEPDNFFQQLSKCVKGEKQGEKCDLLVERAKALQDKMDENSAARLYRFQQELKLTLEIAESGSEDVVVRTPIEKPQPIKQP